MAYESVNLCDGKTLKIFPKLTDEQLEKNANATAYDETWRKTPGAERARIVAKAGALMHQDIYTEVHWFILDDKELPLVPVTTQLCRNLAAK